MYQIQPTHMSWGNITKCILFIIGLSFSKLTYSQSQLIRKIEAGEDQTIVVYGTSLSTGRNGRSWMNEVVRLMNEKYRGKVTYHLSGKGGRCSTWGVQNLEDSVLKKKPDVVMVEFAINDASCLNETSLELAQLNLQYMIDRIRLFDPGCEVILQVMNMAVGKSATYRPNLVAYYDMVRVMARKENLLLIDHYPNWREILNKGENYFLEFVPDGVHPNKMGAEKVIAPFIFQRLKEGVSPCVSLIH